MEMTDHQLIASLNLVRENIQKTMAELASLKEEMVVQTQRDLRSKIFKFIEDSKKAGFTTDLSTMGEFIEKKFSINKDKVRSYLIDYIETSAATINHLSLPLDAPPLIKRKGPKPYSEMTPDELAAAKAAKAAKSVKVEVSVTTPEPVATPVATPEPTEAQVAGSTPTVQVERRVLGVKKISDASKIWHSFVKVVQAEMEATGVKVKYEDVVKKAKEMKNGDRDAYRLFSSTWTPENQASSS